MEKKKIKISFGKFVIGTIVLAVLFIGVFVSIYVSKNNKELDIDCIEVQNLYSRVKRVFDPKLELSYYRSNKITNETLDEDIKLLTVIQELMENKNYNIIKKEDIQTKVEDDNYEYKEMPLADCYIYDYEKEDYVWKENQLGFPSSDVYEFSINSIQKKAREIFNTDIKITKHTIFDMETVIAYDGDSYKVFYEDGGGEYDFLELHKLLKAEKKGNEIILYDNYVKLKALYDENNEKTLIYASSDKKMILKEIDEAYYMHQDDILETNKYNIQIPTYKHIFKKKNGKYYWLSSEIVDEKVQSEYKLLGNKYTEVSLKSDLVQDLLEKISYDTPIKASIYRNDGFTKKGITNDLILRMGFLKAYTDVYDNTNYNIEFLNDGKLKITVSAESLRNHIQKIFGENIKYRDSNFEISGNEIRFIYGNESWEEVKYEGDKYSVVRSYNYNYELEPLIYEYIEKILKYENKIELYVKPAFIDKYKDYKYINSNNLEYINSNNLEYINSNNFKEGFVLYKDYNFREEKFLNKLANLSSEEYYNWDVYLYNFLPFNNISAINQFADKLQTYVYIFEKDKTNNNYYLSEFKRVK